MGRIRAQREHQQSSYAANQTYVKQKSNPSCSLILAWIIFFPFMLTYYIAKSKLSMTLKVVLILLLWLFVLGYSSSDSSETSSSVNTNFIYVNI